MSSRLAAYDPQLEIFEGEQGSAAQWRDEFFGDIQEIELATELLELRDERSLHFFVGRLVRGVAATIGGGGGMPAAEAIQRLLVSVLRQAIPRRGAGDRPAATSIGPMLGDRLADIPGHRLGLELEGLSGEDRRFETARQLVRFAVDAARRALSPSQLDPGGTARAAAFAAARRHAPGLVAGWQPVRAASFGSGFEDRPGQPGSGRSQGPPATEQVRVPALTDL